MSGWYTDMEGQVTATTLELAAHVGDVLKINREAVEKKTGHGLYFVRRVELAWTDGGDTETIGYLVPDEFDGGTWDFFHPKWETKE